MTPSRSFTAEELLEGVVHVDMRTGPSLLRGTLVGGEGQVILGEGDAALDVPAGALADTTSAFVEALELDSIDIEPMGLTLSGAAEVDLGLLRFGGHLTNGEVYGCSDGGEKET